MTMRVALPVHIDTTCFRRDSLRAARARRALRMADDLRLVVRIGRLWQKGSAFLVDATVLSLHRHPQVHSVLIGEGPLPDDQVALLSRRLNRRVALAWCKAVRLTLWGLGLYQIQRQLA